MHEGAVHAPVFNGAVNQALGNADYRGLVKDMLFSLLAQFNGNFSAQVAEICQVNAGKDQAFVVGMDHRSLHGVADSRLLDEAVGEAGVKAFHILAFHPDKRFGVKALGTVAH